ncbi:hypothetical protein SAMN04487981_12750 [Streptomyces sp. cf386]|nr:hypothetical protein SAMN04487981_12750 [Streptomyces sp. cf386]
MDSSLIPCPQRALRWQCRARENGYRPRTTTCNEAIHTTHSEKGLCVRPKYKAFLLIAAAVLSMAALVYVNLQNVRDAGRPVTEVESW